MFLFIFCQKLLSVSVDDHDFSLMLLTGTLYEKKIHQRKTFLKKNNNYLVVRPLKIFFYDFLIIPMGKSWRCTSWITNSGYPSGAPNGISWGGKIYLICKVWHFLLKGGEAKFLCQTFIQRLMSFLRLLHLLPDLVPASLFVHVVLPVDKQKG